MNFSESEEDSQAKEEETSASDAEDSIYEAKRVHYSTMTSA